MKLLKVITTMDPKTGGPSQGIRNINPFLVKEGIQVEILTLDGSDTKFNDDKCIVFHNIGNGLTSFQYNKELDKWLMTHLGEFDVVCVHGMWQYQNYAVFRAIKSLKKQNIKVPKVVIMPHGMLDPYFQKAKDRKFKAIRNELIWRLTEKRAINAADAIFYTCEEEMKLARTTFKGFNPKKEINVGYGIQRPPLFDEPMKQAFEEKCPELKGRNFWLFLSRIHPKKGIDLLIDAYTMLTEQGYQFPDLVIAGPTDSDFAQKMIFKAQKNPHIHFSGMLSNASKWGAFYACDAYLLPSYQENFGIAIVEAMACKKPVLITKKINIWREIEGGDGGWILDKPSIKEVKEHLINIKNLSSEELQQKGQSAFETFEEKFLIDNCHVEFVNAIIGMK